MAFVSTLASGSDGNCVLVSHEGTHLLIDAGISAKRVRQALWDHGLTPEDIPFVLVTHEHGDHTAGLGVLRRPVMAAPLTALRLRERFPKLDISDISPEREFSVGATQIIPFATPHDTADSLGFTLIMGGRRLCLCTDLGHVTRGIAEHAQAAHCLMLESNHDVEMLQKGRYPPSLKRRILGPRGHLSNQAAAELAVRAVHKGAKSVILMHISKDNNRPALALETTRAHLREKGYEAGQHYRLSAAPHGKLTIDN